MSVWPSAYLWPDPRTERFSRLSLKAIFLLSGDQDGFVIKDAGVPREIFRASPMPSGFFKKS